MISKKEIILFVYIVTVSTLTLYSVVEGLPTMLMPRKAGIITSDKMANHLCKKLCASFGEEWSGKSFKSTNPKDSAFCICKRPRILKNN